MYDFYIDRMQLPIAPSKLQLKVNNGNKTIDLMNIGEVNLLKNPKLSDISFEFRLISRGMYQQSEVSAEDYLSKLESLKLNKMPFRFIVTRKGDVGFKYDTNMLVSLESYTITEDANEGSDIFVSVNLKQYKEFGVTTIKEVQQLQPPKPPKQSSKPPSKKKEKITIKQSKKRPHKSPPKAITVKPGESVYIAHKKATGTAKDYREMMVQNRTKKPFHSGKLPKKFKNVTLRKLDIQKKVPLTSVLLGIEKAPWEKNRGSR